MTIDLRLPLKCHLAEKKQHTFVRVDIFMSTFKTHIFIIASKYVHVFVVVVFFRWIRAPYNSGLRCERETRMPNINGVQKQKRHKICVW